MNAEYLVDVFLHYNFTVKIAVFMRDGLMEYIRCLLRSNVYH